MSAIGDACPSSQSGETLIEALVVVAILTLVAAIGFPNLLQALLTLAQRQTVSAVAAELRQARALALERDSEVQFQIAPDGRAYGVVGAPVAAPPPGVTLAGDAKTAGRIAFFGDGSSSGGVVWIATARHAAVVEVGPLGGVSIPSK
ncbi:MAG: prepilin-type N-terminal cleavage/methylation domain-containing protein [Caulobacteraceae bacterium]|nr:prepilin-type N-terminal cleavage/methylation domain-containing protein [Caulobacteraceae bacterium]